VAILDVDGRNPVAGSSASSRASIGAVVDGCPPGIALPAAGLVIVPINARHALPEIRYALQDAGLEPGLRTRAFVTNTLAADKATKDQVEYYIELFKKVRATPEWQDFMKSGAFNTTFLTGADATGWRRDQLPAGREHAEQVRPVDDGRGRHRHRAGGLEELDDLVDLVEHPRREVVVGNAGRLMTMQQSLAPALNERMLATMVDRQHLEDLPAPPTSGSVQPPGLGGPGSAWPPPGRSARPDRRGSGRRGPALRTGGRPGTGTAARGCRRGRSAASPTSRAG
jgi:hypothetical protein